MKRYLAILGAITIAFSSVSFAFDDYDDIYYNPTKEKKQQQPKRTSQSYYIQDFTLMDVDEYNRRYDTYYVSAIDTIGNAVENADDFIYTQQIQKFYNPTIVVDNAEVLGDVLASSYGNVDIIINDAGIPIFQPYSGWYGYYPYYSSWWYPSWGFNVGWWGWNIGYYNPWYSWNWGPTWGWGPGWGWSPGWGWGPGWNGPAPRPFANYRPGGNRPTGPNPGWANSTRPSNNNSPGYGHRPGGNFNGNHNGTVPGMNNGRPGNNKPTMHPAGSGSRQPISTGTGVVNNGGRWQYKSPSQSTGQSQFGTSRPGTQHYGTSSRPTIGNSNIRNNTTSPSQVGTTGRVGSSTNRNTTTTTRPSTNTSRPSTGNSSVSRSTGSTSHFGGGRNTGGGSSRSTGVGGGRSGGGGGRHR